METRLIHIFYVGKFLKCALDLLASRWEHSKLSTVITVTVQTESLGGIQFFFYMFTQAHPSYILPAEDGL